MTQPKDDDHAALVALIRSLPRGQSWSELAGRVLDHGSALEVWHNDDDALLPQPNREHALDQARCDLQEWSTQQWTLLSVLDAEYPSRVRDIYQAPPFLFAEGQIVRDDVAIAIVGSRKASDVGLRIASRVAKALVERGVTVLSGLARGIDSAAHQAALDAGGRTVAIIGNGLAQAYPKENEALQRAIAAQGLVLSQFWPQGPPQPHNFLMRNAVMSGYGHATVVVEAGEKSGARAQARMAVEHGRPVILTRLVVDRNEWAQRLHGRPGVRIAESINEVLGHIDGVLDEESSTEALLADLVAR